MAFQWKVRNFFVSELDHLSATANCNRQGIERRFSRMNLGPRRKIEIGRAPVVVVDFQTGSVACAAQRLDYLENVLRAYQKGGRKSSAMAAMSEVLSDSDVEGLASYYAGKKGRAVMYITLPAK